MAWLSLAIRNPVMWCGGQNRKHKQVAVPPAAFLTGRHLEPIILKRARRWGSRGLWGDSDGYGNTKLICPLFGHPSPPLINCKCTNKEQLLGSQIKRAQRNYTSFRPASLSSTPLLHARVKRLCPTRWRGVGRNRLT